jgi:hypothetical protein
MHVRKLQHIEIAPKKALDAGHDFLLVGRGSAKFFERIEQEYHALGRFLLLDGVDHFLDKGLDLPLYFRQAALNGFSNALAKGGGRLEFGLNFRPGYVFAEAADGVVISVFPDFDIERISGADGLVTEAAITGSDDLIVFGG